MNLIIISLSSADRLLPSTCWREVVRGFVFSAVIVQLLNFNHKPVALSYMFLVVCNGGAALIVVYPVQCYPGTGNFSGTWHVPTAGTRV